MEPRGLGRRFSPLPIPPLLQPDTTGNINLNIQTGTMAWLPSAATQTWGYNGNLLGPAIRLQRGKPVTINVTNSLPEATTLHWHGLEILVKWMVAHRRDSARRKTAGCIYRRTTRCHLLVPPSYPR